MGNVKIANFLQSCYLLRFSLTREHRSLTSTSQSRFSLHSIRITVTSNEHQAHQNRHKIELNPPITNHDLFNSLKYTFDFREVR